MSLDRLPRFLRRFLQEEGGVISVQNLFILFGAGLVSAQAVDVTQLYATRTQIQVAADVAAHAACDARRRHRVDASALWDAPPKLVAQCLCGDIMAGIAAPTMCALYGRECVPESPVGACMVSTEGTCRIWHTYGGVPDLRRRARTPRPEEESR